MSASAKLARQMSRDIDAKCKENPNHHPNQAVAYSRNNRAKGGYAARRAIERPDEAAREGDDHQVAIIALLDSVAPRLPPVEHIRAGRFQ